MTLYICPNADTCTESSLDCEHKTPHEHSFLCDSECFIREKIIAGLCIETTEE